MERTSGEALYELIEIFMQIDLDEDKDEKA